MHRENGENGMRKILPIGHEIRRSERNTTGFEHPNVTWGLRFLAYALPLGFLLYVLYWNFLPFGYEETFVIDVGAPGDTSGQFYLEPSRDLSERKVAPDGTTYRELNGIAYAVFKPKAVLKNATITVTVGGLEDTSPLAYRRKNEVSIIPPVIDFDPNSVDWDYEWDFTNKETALQAITSETATSVPPLEGDAFWFDGCMYFDGNSRLELPGSADMFEEGPFTVYAEWTPKKSTENFQQIVGHLNWELLQDENSVRFSIGRVDGPQGQFFTSLFPIYDNSFFNRRHSLLSTYAPARDGYMELFVDNYFANRTYFATSTIWSDYNNENNLTFGKSGHGSAPNFKGCLYDLRFLSNSIRHSSNSSFSLEGNELRISILGIGTSTFSSIKIDVK